MQCDYFDAHRCRSCEWMGMPYADQLATLQEQVRGLLTSVPADAWLPAISGPESGFRNKAKLAVGGLRGAPTLGILDRAGHGIDLRHCGLYEAGLAQAVPTLADFVADAGLTPYNVPTRNGELKQLIVTHSPDGELMVRFVLRSPGQLGRIRGRLPQLTTAVPGVRVVSVNLLPEHRAVLEGDEEVVLTEAGSLPMRVNDVTLHLRPRSFFQTNTRVAAALYRQAKDFIEQVSPQTVWDVYCGVGGFALHAASPSSARSVRGIEISPDAVESARQSAVQRHESCPTTQFEFTTGDAGGLSLLDAPDLLIVNPPRRGIGPLALAIEESAIPHVLYSSCNARSLASDLAAMPSYRVWSARLFDMFPQTQHHEVLVLLERR